MSWKSNLGEAIKSAEEDGAGEEERTKEWKQEHKSIRPLKELSDEHISSIERSGSNMPTPKGTADRIKKDIRKNPEDYYFHLHRQDPKHYYEITRSEHMNEPPDHIVLHHNNGKDDETRYHLHPGHQFDWPTGTDPSPEDYS